MGPHQVSLRAFLWGRKNRISWQQGDAITPEKIWEKIARVAEERQPLGQTQLKKYQAQDSNHTSERWWLERADSQGKGGILGRQRCRGALPWVFRARKRPRRERWPLGYGVLWQSALQGPYTDASDGWQDNILSEHFALRASDRLPLFLAPRGA